MYLPFGRGMFYFIYVRYPTFNSKLNFYHINFTELCLALFIRKILLKCCLFMANENIQHPTLHTHLYIVCECVYLHEWTLMSGRNNNIWTYSNGWKLMFTISFKMHHPWYSSISVCLQFRNDLYGEITESNHSIVKMILTVANVSQPFDYAMIPRTFFETVICTSNWMSLRVLCMQVVFHGNVNVLQRIANWDSRGKQRDQTDFSQLLQYQFPE